jgi:hypothetical protein
MSSRFKPIPQNNGIHLLPNAAAPVNKIAVQLPTGEVVEATPVFMVGNLTGGQGGMNDVQMVALMAASIMAGDGCGSQEAVKFAHEVVAEAMIQNTKLAERLAKLRTEPPKDEGSSDG